MIGHRFYYGLKPWLPVRLKWALRRWHAQRLRRRSADVWPILPSSGRQPPDWKGWPKGRQFAFVLTHDVESEKGLRRVRRLAELEMSLGFRSSFNFVPEGGYRVSTELLQWLSDRGFEVGVHDHRHDGRLFGSRQGFEASASRINHHLKEWGAVGFRSGFMFHNLDWIRDLNITYDASTFDTDPFEPQPDGAGTIFPYWVPGRRGRPGYVELPYTLPQDSTMFLAFRESSNAIWLEKLDWVAAHGGMAMASVHPDYIALDEDRGRFEYDPEHYLELLRYVASRYAGRAWLSLPREVAVYFRETAVSKRAIEEDSSEVVMRATLAASPPDLNVPELAGRRAAVLLFSYYLSDARPRRAAESLAQLGMEVDLFCLRERSDEPARETVEGVNIRRLPVSRRRGGKLAYLWQYTVFILLSCLALSIRSLRRRIHLVHIHNMPDVLVFAALMPKLFGSKVILDLHDPMPELMKSIFNLSERSKAVRVLQLLEKCSIAFADRVITVNQACKRIFTERSAPEQKVHVVMNSPDEDLFPLREPSVGHLSQRPAGQPFVIMYHGSLVERHGLDLGIEAIRRVRRVFPQIELRVFGGRTPFLDHVLSSIQGTEMETVVRYLGGRRVDEIPGEIAGCDLGIIPNRRSIFTLINTPTRIFEYLACGKPVIAPDAPGIRDYFGADELITFELGNAEELADRILFVIEQPDRAADIVRRGQNIYQKHRWSSERKVFVDLVSELAGETRPYVAAGGRASPQSA